MRNNKELMRKTSSMNASRVLLWTIVVVTVISMAIPTLMKLKPIGSSAIIVMTLNDQEITRAQVTRRYDMLRNQIMMLQQQFAQQGTPFDAAALFNQSKAIAMQSLVNDTLLDEVARKKNIIVSTNYVAEKLANPVFVMQELSEFIPPALIMQQGTLDINVLPNLLRQRGVTMQEFEAFLENSIKRHVVRAMLQAGTSVPEFLLDSACQQRYAKKKFALLSVDNARFKKQAEKENPSDQTLKEFFGEYSSGGHYLIPEKRAAIAYTFKPNAYQFDVTAKEAEEYYTDHKKDFIKEPAKVQLRYLLFEPKDEQKARDIHALLRANPESWQEVAKKQSLKTHTKSVKRTDDAFWSSVAFSLKQDNEITPEIVASPEGIVIVQRISRALPIYKSLSEVESDIYHRLRTAKFEQALSADIAKLRVADDRAAAVEALAKAKKADKKMMPLASATDTQTSKKLFTTSLHDVGLVRDNDTMTLVLVTEIQKSHNPSFEAVKEKVRKDWQTAQANQMMKLQLKEIRQALNDMPATAVAKKYDLGIKTTPLATVHEKDHAIKQLMEDGVTLDSLIYLYRPGASLVFDDANKGYILLLENIEKVECSAKEKESLQEELLKQMQNAFISGFVASLYKGAKITNNQQMLGFTE